jgi:flavodoxin
MKKVILLYDTVYGNTKKVAMSLIRGLEAGGMFVDSSSIQNFKISQLKSYDVIGIGGPTHFHGASKAMKSFLMKIKDFKMPNKQGFAFETKADFVFAGSAAKRIIRDLKKMKLDIIHSTITGIILDKEGPLKENTLIKMEKMGLNLSGKINDSKSQIAFKSKSRGENRESKEDLSSLKSWNRLKWLILGGGPLFFFIRAINLACIGGGCFGIINPYASWSLLSLEMAISGLTGVRGLALWKNGPVANQTLKFRKLFSSKAFLIAVITSYSLHLIRVTIWILLCII